MPITSFATSLSPCSTPAVTVIMESPDLSTHCLESLVPCGIATAFPMYVETDFSRSNIESTYRSSTFPFSTSNAPARWIASSRLLKLAPSSTVFGVSISDIFRLLSQEFVVQVSSKDVLEHRDDLGLRALLESLALRRLLDHGNRDLADSFEGYRGDVERRDHQQGPAHPHHRSVHPLYLQGLVEVVQGEGGPGDGSVAGVKQSQSGPRNPDTAKLYARQQAGLEATRVGDQSPRGERTTHSAHRFGDGAARLVSLQEDVVHELGYQLRSLRHLAQLRLPPAEDLQRLRDRPVREPPAEPLLA